MQTSVKVTAHHAYTSPLPLANTLTLDPLQGTPADRSLMGDPAHDLSVHGLRSIIERQVTADLDDSNKTLEVGRVYS